MFLFTQAYEQDAINSYAPFLFAPFPVSQHTPLSDARRLRLGVFGQGTVTFNDRLDLTAGARLDYEDKSAALAELLRAGRFCPARSVDADKSFSNVSPQVALAYRLQPGQDALCHRRAGIQGRRVQLRRLPPAAKRTARSKPGTSRGASKTLWANGRMSANAAVFYIDWDDLQLNVPNPAVPAQFYISNVGGAVSKGIEVEVSARPAPGVDVFTARWLHTRALRQREASRAA